MNLLNRCRWAWRFQSPAARRASKWRRAPGEPRNDASAQIAPTAARRRFLICRCATTVFFPLARVIGADPAKAFNPRASAKRARSSPISASTRAPARFPRPGKG